MIGILALALIALALLSVFGWRGFRRSSPVPAPAGPEMAAALRSHVFTLSQAIGDRSMFKYEQLERAASYIANQFESFGYEVGWQEYPASGQRAKNIIVEKKGDSLPGEIVVVKTHYNTCFNPGADDNASGVAGALELARLLKKENTARTVRFIAFVNEEPPFFKTESMGSLVYARQARRRGERITAALILEMIGCYSPRPCSQRYPPLLGLFYPNRGDFIAFVGNIHSRGLVKKAAAGFRRASRFPVETLTGFGFIPGVDLSDHWSFWQEGYPAVMITDTAFFRYLHYHRDSDTAEKLDYESMAEVVKGLKGLILDIAR